MNRKGSTLIEVALTLPVVCALMVLATGGVHQMMRLSHVASDRARVTRSIARLNLNLRSDAKRAIQAEIRGDSSGKGSSLQLRLAEMELIVYRVEAKHIIRELRNDSDLLASESYTLFSENIVEWRLTPTSKMLDEKNDAQGIGESFQLSIYRSHSEHVDAKRLEALIQCRVGRGSLSVNGDAE